MVYNLFSIHIILHDDRTYTIPIPRKFLPEFVFPSGTITAEGITFLLNEFYFLNQIRYANIRCNDYISMFMLFGHRHTIRDSIVFNSANTMRRLKDCSLIFNHTHIGVNNFLTPEGVELIFGPHHYNNACIYISNYFQVFKEYYEYCSEDFITVTLPVTLPLPQPVTPERKHKADEELVCPNAPKKARM